MASDLPDITSGPAANDDAQAPSVLETAHEAYLAMDAGGFICDWNLSAEAMFGFSRPEVLGRVLSDTIIPERYRAAHLAGLQRYLGGGEAKVLGQRIELDALHRKGHEFPIEITISSTRRDGVPAFHAFLHDISERRRRQRYIETQHATTLALAEAETVAAAMERMLAALGGGMDWEFGAWWSLDEGEELTCRATWHAGDAGLGEFAEVSRRLVLRRGAGLPGRVLESGRPAFIEAITEDGGFRRQEAAAAAGLTTAVALPIEVGDGDRGVVEFLTRATIHADPELIEMMETITKQIGRFTTILAERERLVERLEHLALTDELTGLPNRRAWDQGLEREIGRARRADEPLCMALLDLDRFKRFNDEHGHQAGDLVLREAAEAWAAGLRATDLLARYGGEEFALAFPAWPVEAALMVVDRLRAVTPAGVTCSAGLATWRPDESPAALIGRADTALYEAKRAGRDRSVVAA